MSSLSKYNKLAYKRVLILGGTSGIGFCVAEGCIEHGATVIISGTSQQKIQHATDRLRASYPSAGPEQITGYACDLADTSILESNLESLLQKATQAGKLNHIVSTAGDAIRVIPITQLTVADIPPAMAVRVYSALILAKFIPKYMELSSESSLTITGGTKLDKLMPGFSLVAAMGGALQAIGRELNVDLQPVRVNVVSPGLVYTERFKSIVSEERREALLEAVKKSTTTGQICMPENVAEAYLYSMKDRSLAGVTIGSNGGALLA